MWDLIVSVPDHCLSFYFSFVLSFAIISVLNVSNPCSFKQFKNR